MDSEGANLHAEQRARVLIDAQLAAAGWVVQDKAELNLFAAPGIAVREAVLAPGAGRADYLLYVDRQIVGVIEAKSAGTTLSGVEWQSARYAAGLSEAQRSRAVLTAEGRSPFVFEASGSETHLTCGFDPAPRARSVFAFPRQEHLARTVREAHEHPDAPTWRGRVRDLPPLEVEGLRPAQVTAIRALERSLSSTPRA